MTATPLPLVSPVPPTEMSGPYNQASPEVLAEVGYVEEEYFITGLSTIYKYDENWGAIPARENVPYTTQLLVRRPKDPAKFSGNVIVEALHGGVPVGGMFSLCWDFFCANGDAWAQVLPFDHRAPLEYDPERYGPLNMMDLGQIWDALSQAGVLLRSGDPSSPLYGYDVRHLYATGVSGTGTLLLTYLGEGFHERNRLPDGGPIFDGYVPYIAAGLVQYYRLSSPPFGVKPHGFLGRNEGMPHPFEQFPLDDPRRTAQSHDVPVIQVLTECEVIIMADPPPVRDMAPNMFNFGTPPTAEARLRHRRPDGDAPGDRFRLYEIAGPGHSSSMPEYMTRMTRVQPFTARQQMRLGQSRGDLSGRLGKPTSDFPSHYIVAGVWASLFKWVDEGVAPPRAAPIEIDDNMKLVRDEFGNAKGGVRSPWIDVPVATYTGVNPGMALAGAKEPFDAEKLTSLYHDHATYLRCFNARTDELVEQGWLAPAQVDRIKEEADAFDGI